MPFHKEVDHLLIPLEDILLATNTFAIDKLIAKGGFGSVFKGQSETHGTIAVKRLDRWHGQGEREFNMEIALLSIYKHENIVFLHGFCNENGEKILVYKHERNGSLDRHLKNKDLTWIQRLQICLDASRGLKYLHDDVGDQHRIIHCDIKSSNILLDENWKAKISDFGLSKVGPANVQRTFLISNACGTPGYVDPEYAINCILTQKSDVYSFGVVLFEVLCGRLAFIQEYEDIDRRFLSRLGRLHYEKGTLDEIINSNLRDQMDSDSLSKFSTIAYQCLEKKGEDRPKMSLVVEQLQEALYVQQAFIEQSSVASSSKSSNETVFISFRGEDISKTFVDHLYSAFVQRGIYTYLSDQTVAEDELVNPHVLKDIQESQVAIIVFSKNCMTRRFLEEIAYIMECMDERGQIVKPIYYGVDYLHMQKEIENHKDMFSNKVVSWIDALMDANNLSGWRVPENSANWYDLKCINQIVDTVSHGLLPLTSSCHTNLVGLATRMQDLKSLLKIGDGGVRMVGIWGIGGGGKSALAFSMYKEICHEFESCCFIENVGEESSKHGLRKLQQIVLLRVLKQKEAIVRSIEEGKGMIKSRSCNINVLIVLDDVDHLDQLECLAGSHDWFGKGSRIIITTRNKHLLNAHKVDGIYSVNPLCRVEADELFSRHLFGQHTPPDSYYYLCRLANNEAQGHPLAVKVLGLFLRNCDVNEWETTVISSSHSWHIEIMENLQISYDGLEPEEKELFLEIVCLTAKSSEVTLKEFGYDTKKVNVLIEKALIYDNLSSTEGYMHYFVKEMGLLCIREEHRKAGQKEDVLDIYSMDSKKGVANMKKVRWICWKEYSESMLPTNFEPMELRCLILQRSLQKQLWEGYKHLPSLKVLSLDCSYQLTKTPDFNGLPCLERMTLRKCSNLEEIHPSIGYHERLVFLDMTLCKKLKKFPPIIQMKKLETLILSCCYKLVKFPDIQIKLDSLVTLCLDGSGIKVIPSSVGKYCTNLVYIYLNSCHDLKSIESDFRSLKSLKELNLHNCDKLGELPEDLFDGECCLEVLSLSRCHPLTNSKSSIRNLIMSRISSRSSRKELVTSWKFPDFPRFLRKLSVTFSNLVDEDIPVAFGHELSNLIELDLSGNKFSRLHSGLSHLPALRFLNLSYCNTLLELPLLPSTIAVLEATRCESLEIVQDLPPYYRWLWKVSLWGYGKTRVIGAERLLRSMLQGNAAENYYMSLSLGRIYMDPLILRNPGSENFMMQLPENWCSDFSGFLICYPSRHSQSNVIVMKQEMCMDSKCNLWNDLDKTFELDPEVREVGYVSFNSLMCTTWWNSAHTNISFSLQPNRDPIQVFLVPRKGKTEVESAKGGLTTEFWDGERKDKKTFRILRDSNYSVEIDWNVGYNL